MGVQLPLVEPSGAMNAAGVTLLQQLGKAARLPSVDDRTVYGVARGSHRSYFTHHLAAIATAVAHADAMTIERAGRDLTLQLATAAAPPPVTAAAPPPATPAATGHAPLPSAAE